MSHAAATATAGPREPIEWYRLWVFGCAYLTLAGWGLSALRALNTMGYVVTVAVGLVGLIAWCLPCLSAKAKACSGGVKILRRRFTRLFPGLFLIYLLAALIGGALYAPTNYDAMTYRLPRLLHWLAEQRWHWIATVNERMNLSATGFEWLMAPFVALTHSDRFLFLINVLGCALLPGLIFGSFTRLGINKRVAWYWMWLLPTGYCFVTQAGGIGNDLVSAVDLLAALFFTLRARENGSGLDLATGLIAAALLSGAKASNLPLLLPCALAALPAFKVVFTKGGSSPHVDATAGSRTIAQSRISRRLFLSAWFFLGMVCAGVSFLPVAWANVRFAGDWTGDASNRARLKITNPVYGVIGNGLMLLSDCAHPPVMPLVKGWNQKMQIIMEQPFFQKLKRYYPRFTLGWGELTQEEGAGIGLGLSVLILVTLVAGMKRRSPNPNHTGRRPMSVVLLFLGAWVALAAYMAKMGSEAAARLVTPYYPLLFASLLFLPGTAVVVWLRWWRTLAFLAAASALPAVILSATRPLWPAETVCKSLERRFPNSSLVSRAATVYAVYGQRGDALGSLRQYIPAETKVIGFAGTEDDPETGLWRPFGSRRVLDLTKENTDELLGKEVETVVASAAGIEENYNCSLEQWLSEKHLRVLGREELVVKVAQGKQEWVVATTSPRN